MTTTSSATRKPRASILVVEDDPEIAAMFRDVLEVRAGYAVHHVENGADAERAMEEEPPDLVILDLMLPDADGLVICANIKARADVPVIICSATQRKRDAVIGFKLGADDFIPKPFDPAELEARVEAVLRRFAASHGAESEPLAESPAAGTAASPGLAPPRNDRQQIGNLLIDNARRLVALGGQPVPVTPTEYRLLRALASRLDEVFSRDELAQTVWGYQDPSIGRAIDVHIRRLRAKLVAGPVPSPAIVSVRGFGFKLSPDPAATDTD